MIKFLLRNGADVNRKDTYGDTPLHIAVLASTDTVTQTLLDNGADINANNHNGDTALHLAANRSLSMMILLHQGASVTYRDNQGHSPLHTAAYATLPMVQELLQRGAYSYPCDETDDILYDFWEQRTMHTPQELRFYTTLLISGVSTQNQTLPESLGIIQSHIELTVKERSGLVSLTSL